MVDMPLVYEDTAFLGDVEAIQCCVPSCAEKGRGLCQAQGLENWGTSLGISCPYLHATPTACPPQASYSTLGGNVGEQKRGNCPAPSLAPIFPRPYVSPALLFVPRGALSHSLEPWELPAWLRTQDAYLRITRPTNGQMKCSLSLSFLFPYLRTFFSLLLEREEGRETSV